MKRTIGLTAIALALAGCATAPQAPTNLADTAAKTPQLSTLTRLINEAGLAETLRGPGPYTVFAPSDDAFKALPAKTMQELASDKEKLRAVLRYHVVAAKINSAEAKSGAVKSLQGGSLAVSRSGGFLTVESAIVTQPDVAATNGVVQVIDTVLMPPR